MQYFPFQNIPCISIVNGGLIELIQSFGHEIVSSADLVQLFEAKIDEEGYYLHKEAAKLINEIKDPAFEKIRKAIRDHKELSEYSLACFIKDKIEEYGLTNEEEIPIAGTNDHPANPHFEPNPENSYVFREVIKS
jgi:Xaa-Pro aminopeptidase